MSSISIPFKLIIKALVVEFLMKSQTIRTWTTTSAFI